MTCPIFKTWCAKFTITYSTRGPSFYTLFTRETLTQVKLSTPGPKHHESMFDKRLNRMLMHFTCWVKHAILEDIRPFQHDVGGRAICFPRSVFYPGARQLVQQIREKSCILW